MLTWWLRVAIATSLAAVATPLSSADAASPSAATAGRLSVLTYNVAGLPESLSGLRPAVNLPVIGALLNRYDLAVVQEDFAYPLELRREIRLPHGSPPFVRADRMDFGDGLSQFARLPFSGLQREAWKSCNGIVDSYFDCLTPKGFTFSRQQLAEQVFVDVYNVHMDAGPGVADRRARAAQVEQLALAVRSRSEGRAVLVAGDFNLGSAELERLDWLRSEVGLVDSCKQLRCPEPWRIDRVLFRSSEALKLAPKSWRVDRRFVDTARRPLSDHLAVAVELEWAATSQRFAREDRASTPGG